MKIAAIARIVTRGLRFPVPTDLKLEYRRVLTIKTDRVPTNTIINPL
jgi:hypothetical protein